MITGSQIEDISKTALIPLWARANADKYTGVNSREWKLSKSIASQFDTSRLDSMNKIARDTTIIDIAIRSILINDIIKKSEKNRTFINFGAGLDVKSIIFKNDFENLINIDTQAMIDLRSKIFPEELSMTSSILEPDFLDKINDSSPLIIIEGVFMYFNIETVNNFLSKVKEHAPDSKLIFEVGGSWINFTGHPGFKALGLECKYIWGVNGRMELEKRLPNIRITEHYKILDMYPEIWGNYRYLFKIFPILKNKLGSQIVVAEF